MQGTGINWSEYALKDDLRAVMDPADLAGHKNRYINLLHHEILKRAFKNRLQGCSVLDLGCGNGRFYDLLKECGASHVIGADSCYSMMKKYPGTAVHAYATLLPFPDEYFDAVLSVWTLQHLDSRELHAAVSEISRVMKPHGRIYLIEQMSERGYDGVPARTPWDYRNHIVERGYVLERYRPIMLDSDLLVGVIRHGIIPEMLFPGISGLHLATTRTLSPPEAGYLDAFLEFERVR